MSRRLLQAAMIVFVLAVLLAGSARPADAAIANSPIGVYHGFFQSTTTPGRWGLVEFAITQTRNRRFFGMVTMIIPAGASEIRLPFSVDGTLAADDQTTDDAGAIGNELGHNLLGHGGANFSGVGRSAAGSVEFHGRLRFFAGGAALADSTYQFNSPPEPDTGAVAPPDPDRGTATILRDFNTTTPAPNVSGGWDGNYLSAINGGQGTLHLDIMQSCAAPPDPATNLPPLLSNGFTGQEIVDRGSGHELTLYFNGSIGGAPFVVIGWDLGGDRFVVTGGFTSPPDPDRPASAAAMYELLFANGSVDRGTFDITQQFTPPNPCRGTGEAGQ